MKISVIIPTYNRVGLLTRQLRSLSKQTLSATLFEIIVVNDGSNDGTTDFLEKWSTENRHYHVIHQVNAGPARARNAGIAMASGEIIAFTDDDCEVHEDWLEIVLHSMRSEIVGLQGATYTDHSQVTPLTHQIDNETGHNSTPTCNAAYRKSILQAVGGFDETFPNPHNEDTDVSWRVRELGQVLFCPAMRVYHPPRRDKFLKVARRMKIMECEFTLFRKNPQLYRRYRDSNPFRHIYIEVFIKTIGYYFFSRVKLWNKPKQMIQGMSLAVAWWYSLLVKLPRYYRLQRALDTRF